MAAHRIFRWATESVFAARDGSPAGTFYLPMDTPNSYRPQQTRPMWAIRDGSGLNVPRLTGSEIVRGGGNLSTRIYWDQGVAQYLVPWLSRVNAGSTTPWPTDQKPSDYASASIDFGYGFVDDTIAREALLGCKPGPSVSFSCAATPENPFLMMSCDIIGATPIPNVYAIGGSAPTSGAFPDPALTAIPALPLTFQECIWTSHVTGSSVAYNLFDRFSISISSIVAPYFDNGRTANRIHCRGRSVTLTVHPRLDAALEGRRAFYEAVLALGACTIEFTNPALPGGHTTHDKLNFNFRSQSFLNSVTEDMILDADPYTEWTSTAYLDTSPGDDFLITYTAGA